MTKNKITGAKLIKTYLPEAPTLPGVYRMHDLSGSIIYIGKAKNLKNRLTQYSLKTEGKTKVMVSLVSKVIYNVTNSESDALLLEGQLIKKFKPRFNILLKDDKSFPYIKLRTDHEYPQILKFRGRNLAEGKFFGPFASVKHVDITIKELQKIFKLRSCSDSYFAARERPCLQYQIGRCCAPCVDKVSRDEYKELIGEVKDFLSGKSQSLQKNLSKKMQGFSDDMEYEKAALVRDKIKALSYIQMKSETSHNLKDADVIAISGRNGEFCVQLFMYRSHQPCGNQPYFPANTHEEQTEQEVLSSFLTQIYQSKTPPEQILLSHEIESVDAYKQAFKEMHNVNVGISTPKLGAKKKLMDNALHNAQLELEKHLKISAKNVVALKEVQKLFDLESLPERIEVYDNSHIQGAFALGAMVVAGREGFEKKEYRLYNIKEKMENVFGGDDYAMLSEVLTRRLGRLKSEPHRTPDLMIIDGGRGHMSTVEKIMNKLDIDIPFVCMSKGKERNSGREQFHRPGKESFTLDRNIGVMKYLQILRDEVHNFAITSHRKKRSSAIKVSSLDGITGVGESRKKSLLNYFGSYKAITEASEAEISKAEGVSKNLAKIIYNAIHGS